MLIDIEKLEILENNSDFELLYSNNKASELLENTALDHYKYIQDRSLGNTQRRKKKYGIRQGYQECV